MDMLALALVLLAISRPHWPRAAAVMWMAFLLHRARSLDEDTTRELARALHPTPTAPSDGSPQPVPEP